MAINARTPKTMPTIMPVLEDLEVAPLGAGVPVEPGDILVLSGYAAVLSEPDEPEVEVAVDPDEVSLAGEPRAPFPLADPDVEVGPFVAEAGVLLVLEAAELEDPLLELVVEEAEVVEELCPAFPLFPPAVLCEPEAFVDDAVF